LIEAYQKARKTGQKFALAAVSDSALRVLNLARMDKVFTICPSVAAGLAKVR
jgi:anti-sigma B factor antagonist